MKKSGFTLIELLAVITIIALLSIMGTVGVVSLKKAINTSMWQKNIDFIEQAGVKYGEDKKNWLNKQNCTLNNEKKSHCVLLSVQTLIDKNYLNSKERINFNEDKNYKVIINYTIEKVSSEQKNFENGYYVNEKKIYIYIENGVVYAEYMG